MRRFLLTSTLLCAIAAPAWGAGLEDGTWRGNVRCEDRARLNFEVRVTGGRFSFSNRVHSIEGEFQGQDFNIRGKNLWGDDYSFSGTAEGDSINASDGGLFSTCYVNLFRASTPDEQRAIDAAAKTTREAEGKSKAEEVARLKAEYQRLVEEEEEAKKKAETTIGVVTSAGKLGVQSSIPRPAEAAAEIARLRKKLEEMQIANEASKASGAVEARASGLQAIPGLKGVDFGRYHALVIGINKYQHLPRLKTAVNDAKDVARLLEKEYGFKVKLLLNAGRGDIVEALDEYRETLGPNDNLLIYYAGHGWLDEEVDRGYWLPANAKPKRRTNWVSNATVTDTLKSLDAKHVMVVADSCYSGTLVRSANVAPRRRAGDYWKRMAKKWARVAITSGGLEPVVDKGGGRNSPFAKAFIDALRSNKAIMDGTELFQSLRRPVMVAAQQTPEYSDVRNAGHDGGDFLFVRKK